MTELKDFPVDTTFSLHPSFVVSLSVMLRCIEINKSTSMYNDMYRLAQISLLCNILCRNHHPMLLAQWQEGVTRSDLAKEFSFEEFIKVSLIHLL
jgi:hypothetical protein